MSTTWTVNDALQSLCSAEDIGQPKPSAPTSVNLKTATQSAVDRLGHDAIAREIAANPGVYLPMILKHGLVQLSKQEPEPVPDIETLSDVELEALSSADLKRILLHSAGIRTKDQVQSALGE